MTGIEAFLEVLVGAGVTHLFGNPGTTELPLNDAMARDQRIRYVFGLHEIPVLSMADGYAQASGKIGVANVHIACGLGNAMGMLYNAHVAGTPLLLTAGQQDRRLQLTEPVLAGDLVGVARPWTKWAYEVGRVEDVPQAVRRAVQVALTPPTGPVFLALPLDVQSARAEGLDLSPPHVPDRRTRPPLAALQKAAAVLAGARAPVILAGSRVAEAGAFRELAAVAERLGAPVFSEAATSHGRLPLATDHPLYAGPLPLWSPQVRDRLAGHDVILAVGLNLLRLYIHQEPERPLPDDARLIHLDNVPWEVGKNYPVEIGLVGDPQSGLAELDALLAARPGPPPSAAARERLQRHATARRAEQAALRSAIDRQDRDRPMPPLALMGALVRAMPANALVVEEAVTTHQNVLERLGALKDPAAWFAHRGWALGWGLGCALGVKLARPDRPVLGLIGDGATMYGLQALWTAAHHRIGAVFVICNNAQYKILKDCAALLPLPEMARGNHLAMDLVRPAIDFVGLARSLGVEAHRVEGPDEAAERVRAGLQGDRPLVLEAVLGA